MPARCGRGRPRGGAARAAGARRRRRRPASRGPRWRAWRRAGRGRGRDPRRRAAGSAVVCDVSAGGRVSAVRRMARPGPRPPAGGPARSQPPRPPAAASRRALLRRLGAWSAAVVCLPPRGTATVAGARVKGSGRVASDRWRGCCEAGGRLTLPSRPRPARRPPLLPHGRGRGRRPAPRAVAGGHGVCGREGERGSGRGARCARGARNAAPKRARCARHRARDGHPRLCRLDVDGARVTEKRGKEGERACRHPPLPSPPTHPPSPSLTPRTAAPPLAPGSGAPQTRRRRPPESSARGRRTGSTRRRAAAHRAGRRPTRRPGARRR